MEVKDGYKLTEVGIIPKDWEVTSVGDEFFIQLGKMLNIEKNVGVPKLYLGNRAIQWGRIDLSDIGFVKMTPSDLQRYRLRDGDLLVCEGGEVGRAAIWEEPISECYYQKALHRLRPRRGYNVTLMLNVLYHLASTGFLSNYVTQTSIAHLPKDKFETVPIPLPPLAEQEAIAEALSDADALIEALECLIAKKRQVKQGAMQELLTGRRRLPAFEDKFGYEKTEVGMIPSEWNVSTLGAVCSFENGDRGRNYPSRTSYASDGVPFINAGHVEDGYIKINELNYIPKEKFDLLNGGKVLPGDILFCLRGSLGKFGIVGSNFGDGAIASSLVIIRPKTGRINREYLYWYFRSSYCVHMIDKWSGGAAQPNLGVQDLVRFTIPIPPTEEEQTAIAEILSDMDAEITALEGKLSKAREVKAGMMSELLTGRIRLVES